MQTPITNRDPNDRRSKRLSSIVSINNKKKDTVEAIIGANENILRKELNNKIE